MIYSFSFHFKWIEQKIGRYFLDQKMRVVLGLDSMVKMDGQRKSIANGIMPYRLPENEQKKAKILTYHHDTIIILTASLALYWFYKLHKRTNNSFHMSHSPYKENDMTIRKTFIGSTEHTRKKTFSWNCITYTLSIGKGTVASFVRRWLHEIKYRDRQIMQ